MFGGYSEKEFTSSKFLSLTGSFTLYKSMLQFSFMMNQFDNSQHNYTSVNKNYRINYFKNIMFGPSWLTKMSYIQLSADYDSYCKKWCNYAIQWNKRINRLCSISINFIDNLKINNKEISFKFDLILPISRIQTNYNYNSNIQDFERIHQFKGSVFYDMNNKNIKLGNRECTGKGITVVRFFYDQNNNKIFDHGEEMISKGNIDFDDFCQVNNSSDGLVYIKELTPYKFYEGNVNLSKIRNPLLVPFIEKVQFTALPNKIQQIDIPLYTSGIIDGSVMYLDENGRKPLSGIRLFLQDKNDPENFQTITVFSDGTFYKMNVKPGSYRLWIDENS